MSGTPRTPDRVDAIDDTDPAAPADAVSRRAFLVRAGQMGALSAMGPSLGRIFGPFPKQFTPDGVAVEAATAATMAAPTTAPVAPALFSGLRWRMLGPFRGGRCAAATGVPSRPNEFYMGSVNGGVWKSIDGGRVWLPVFDDQPVASIGAIAVAPSAPDTVYVGTGESTLRDSLGFGNGVYKSTDAGKTWTHLGLDETHHVMKIAVDPRNPNIAFVAALGHMYAANPDRGVFRTRDGGKTWQKVLFKNNDIGATEVIIDPTNSQIVYAGLWNARRPPWYTYSPSNGPGGGIFKSTDGGTTWKQLTTGLPTGNIGHSGIAVSAANPRRVYAVIDCLETGSAAQAEPALGAPPAPIPAAPAPAGGGPAPLQQGGFFRSDDSGATWTRLQTDGALWGRGWYFEKVIADPKNADIVYVANVSVSRTKDGGKTWVALRGSPGGDDYHQPWVSPDDSDTMIVASDQGTVITRNARTEDPTQVTFTSWLNQPIAQIYHVSVDPREPYWVTGAQQDSGSVAVHSRGKFAAISTRDWEPIGAGGESGFTVGDPLHPGIIYGGTGGRFDLELNRAVPGTTTPRSPETARTDWSQPLVISGADPHVVFYANQFLFKTTDGAQTWAQVSPDLTRPDPGVPATLDAATAAHTDRNGKRGVIYAVAPSPLLIPMVWAGTDDGFIHVTTDDGKTWQNVTPPAMTAWSRVTGIEASHFDLNAAYASVSRHQLQDFDPYIYRTRDQGRTWQKITTGLPAGVYVHVVKEDPKRRGLLFAGTERGAFVSFDDGDSWQPLQLNLPVSSMRDFQIYQNDLIVGTHGRGFWVIDDISPLRQITDALGQADVYLFQPADAITWVQGGDNGTPMQKDEPMTPNAPDGAAIDYYLRSASPVTLEILDAAGAVLQSYSTQPAAAGGAGAGGGRGGGRGGAAAPGGGPGGAAIPNTMALWRTTPEAFSGSAGMHRVVWNPPAGGGGRAGGGRGGGSTLPATFTARLTVNGQRSMRTFTVRPDPRTSGR